MNYYVNEDYLKTHPDVLLSLNNYENKYQINKTIINKIEEDTIKVQIFDGVITLDNIYNKENTEYVLKD